MPHPSRLFICEKKRVTGGFREQDATAKTRHNRPRSTPRRHSRENANENSEMPLVVTTLKQFEITDERTPRATR